MAYLTFSVESREERFAKQGVRREDYPSQRVYDAACDLIDLQNGKGYVPSASTRQREIDRRRFLVEGGCVAARYLTLHDGFLYAQAVKENFPLPIEVPDEDERPVTSLDDLFLDLAEEDPALAVRVWAWIIREFGPYPQYMDGVWMPFNGLLYLTFRFPPEFREIALEELCQNSDFRRGLLETSPDLCPVPWAGGPGDHPAEVRFEEPPRQGRAVRGAGTEHLLPHARGQGPGALGGPGADGVPHPGGPPRQAHPAAASPVERRGGPAHPVEASQAGAPAAPVRRPAGGHGQDRVHLLRGAVPRVAAGVLLPHRRRDAGCGGQSAGSRQRRPHRGRGRIH